VIVEVQLRPDQRKHLSWPAYLATARARLGSPALLLVICPESRVAAWARQSIPLGHPGLVLTPLVLGPEEVPVLTAPEVNTGPRPSGGDDDDRNPRIQERLRPPLLRPG
jgi:hypothetical protein